MKRQPTRMGDIFANVVNDKGLTSQIYKTTIKPQQQQKNQSKKWAEDLNTYFFKEEI